MLKYQETEGVIDSFNSAHALSVAFDSLYGAYLKANYPLEYFTVALNEFINTPEKVESLIKELPYFHLSLSSPKLSNPSGEFGYDKETNTIYQGVGSIKFLTKQIGEDLKQLSNKHYDSFIDVLDDLTALKINSRQIDRLIKSDFFSEQFDNQNKLLYMLELYNKYRKMKSFTLKKIGNDEMILNILEEFATEDIVEKQKDKFKTNDMFNTLKLIENKVDINPPFISDILSNQIETIGTISYKNNKLDKRYVAVCNLNVKYSPVFDAYCLNNGQSIPLKVAKKKRWNSENDNYNDTPFENGDILYVEKFKKEVKSIYVNGKWEKTNPPQYEWWATKYIKTDIKSEEDYE